MPTAALAARPGRALGALGLTLALLAAGCASASSTGHRSVAKPARHPAPSTGASPTAAVTTLPVPTPTPPATAVAAPTPSAVTSPPPAPAGADRPVRDLPVAPATFQFVDTTRPTQTESGVLVASTRTLPTTVWYPADRPGPWPLIVFGHGFQIGPAPYDRLCQQWAAAGYVVASPSFPLTDQSRAGQYLDENDMIHQPSDMSFLITQLEAISRSGAGTGPLAGRVDPARIAVAGHSDGATSALAVGYYPATTDRRVKAVVALSANPFPTLATATGTATLLDVHGDADSITPFENGQKVMDQIQTRRFFLVLHGADHLPPVIGSTPWTPILDAVTTDFLDRYLAGRTAGDDSLLAQGNAQPTLAELTARG